MEEKKRVGKCMQEWDYVGDGFFQFFSPLLLMPSMPQEPTKYDCLECGVLHQIRIGMLMFLRTEARSIKYYISWTSECARR